MTRQNRIALATAMLVACGQSPPTSSQRSAASVSSAPSVTLSSTLVRDLSALLTREPPTESMKERAARGDLDGLVSELIAHPTFAKAVAPVMLLAHWRFAQHNGISPRNVLKQTTDADGLIHYLRKPCAAAETDEVEPWWALGTKVRICRSDYRPELVTVDQYACGGHYGIDVGCGCGRNLIHCYRDRRHHDSLRASNLAEVNDTIALAVSSGSSIQDIFLANATVRDRNAEILLRRRDIALGKPWKEGLDQFASPRLMPRAEAFPGQHSGILTATNIVRAADAPRVILVVMYSLMTCANSNNAHVTAPEALAIDSANLRADSDGKEFLASAKGCTDCHARLDHGIAFFAGWRSAYHASYFEAEFHPVTSDARLFFANNRDLRATGQSTPRSFAEMLMAQPEFAACQARRIGRFVLGGASDAALENDLAAMIKARAPIREIVKAAVIAYATRAASGQERDADAAPPATLDAAQIFEDDARRRLDAPLVSSLEICSGCHADSWLGRVFESGTATSLELLKMADKVASGAMPKGVTLAATARQQLVTTLTRTAWNDREAGTETARALLGLERPAAVHELSTAMEILRRTDHVTSETNWMVPELLFSEGNNYLTPGMASVYGIEALRGCRRSARDSDVASCIDAVLRRGAYLRGANLEDR